MPCHFSTMDDLLIENLEEDAAAAVVPHSSTTTDKKGHQSKVKKPKSSTDKPGPSTAESKNADTLAAESGASELCPETIVTMYTSDIQSTEVRSFPGRQTSAGLYFSGASEAESNVKCVLTTILFLAVVAAIIVVAIFKNPGM